MGEARDRLRDYYEREAETRVRVGSELREGRLGVRATFIDLLEREGLRSVVDFGAGPGRDGDAFRAAGHDFFGIDLAVGNAHLAAEAGLCVVPGSLLALPLRSASFDAGVSFSTLMHLDDAEVDRALGEMTRVLRPGAPLLIGVWGKETEDTSVVEISDIDNSLGRPFHIRSMETNAAFVAGHGHIEHSERWDGTSLDQGWDYQVFRLRTSAAF